MPRVHRGTIAILCALAAGCAHGPIGTLPTAPPLHEAAEVFAIRPSDGIGVIRNWNKYRITWDGQEVFGIGEGEYASFNVAPGMHSIGVRCFGGFTPTWKEDRLEARFTARMRYYFLVSRSVSCAEIKVLTDTEGPAWLSRSRNVESDRTGRIAMPGLSVLPPQEEKWALMIGSTFQVAFGKGGPQSDATYMAVVDLYQLPDFESADQFFAHVSKGRLAEPDIGRFRFIKNEEELRRGEDFYCLEYKTISKDQGAATPAGKKTMLLQMIGRHCQHPKRKNVGVHIEYSHRHYAGDEDPEIQRKADAFLDHVTFTDF